MTQDYMKYDVVMVDFGDGQGSEVRGNHPAIIIQNNKGNYFANTTIVLPFTSKINKNPNQATHCIIKKGSQKGLVKDSMIQAECIRQISKSRIIKSLGKITDEEEKAKIKNCYLASFGE